MTATPSSLFWAADGTRRLIEAVQKLSDDEFREPTELAGWSRAHVLAHVASNAEALGRLAYWATSGEETPMYPSPQQRNLDIENGANEPADKIRQKVISTAEVLQQVFDTMPAQAWSSEVVTIQRRTIPASVLPWLRAREVYVHLVDIGGASFEDLPSDFCRALIDDIVERRNTQGGPALELHAADSDASWQVEGAEPAHKVVLSTAQLAGWLSGRSTRSELPSLPAWL